jgi:hypothetical protein
MAASPIDLEALSLEPLFEQDGPPAAPELGRLIGWARAMTDGPNPEWTRVAAWAPVKRAVPSTLVARVRRGEAPPVGLEVLAGLTALLAPNHRMRAFWHAAWELSEPVAPDAEAPLLGLDDLAFVAATERAEGAAVGAAVRGEIEAEARAERERARVWKARREAGIAARKARDSESAARFREVLEIEGRTAAILEVRRRIAGAPGADPELAAAAARLAPIGAGGPSVADMAEARPLVWSNHAEAPAWEALCMAFDVLGAGSFASLDRLGAIASVSPSSPAIAFLDEIACRVSREDGRASRRAAELDALLASGMFGRNAPRVPASVRLARAAMTAEGVHVHDAWLRLSAARRASASSPPIAPEVSPRQEAAIRRAARRGDETAMLWVTRHAMAERAAAAELADAERAGPFHGLSPLPDEVIAAVESVSCYALFGFRELYGLELLREGIGDLAAWLERDRRA